MVAPGKYPEVHSAALEEAGAVFVLEEVASLLDLLA
jgi:hypothetical protein